MSDDAEKQAAALIEELTNVHRGWCEYCKGDGEICERTKDSYRCVVPQTREAVAERIRKLKAELEAAWRLYDLRGAALRRGCPACGYVQAAIVAQAEVKK